MARLALIGPPGSGKSAVGRAVADDLGVPFVDIAETLGGTDALVTLGEEEASLRVAELIRDAGADAVIAMPSWTMQGPDGTLTVYLSASAADTYARSGMNRPGPVGLVNPRSMWQLMLRERDPKYRAGSAVVIEIGRDAVTDVAAKVIAYLR